MKRIEWKLARGDRNVFEANLCGRRLIIHRWRDEHPDQWVYSCYALGIEHVAIGERGATIEEVQPLVIDALFETLEPLVTVLKASRLERPTP
jgi:DMSO/TMAO reductase YedYZ heme-binding membrane subunit